MQEYYVQFYNTDSRGISYFVEEIIVKAKCNLGLQAQAIEHKYNNNYSKYECWTKRT